MLIVVLFALHQHLRPGHFIKETCILHSCLCQLYTHTLQLHVFFYYFFIYTTFSDLVKLETTTQKYHYNLAHKWSSLDVTNIHSSQLTATQIYGTWILMTFTRRFCCNTDIIPFQRQSCQCKYYWYSWK